MNFNNLLDYVANVSMHDTDMIGFKVKAMIQPWLTFFARLGLFSTP